MFKDSIFIEGLSLKATIGVYEWEQKIQQKLLIDVMVETELSAAGAQDDLAKTLSYAWLADQITEKVEQSHYALLEALLAELGDWLAALDNVIAYRLTIHKPAAVKDTASVGVRRVWQRPKS